MKPALPSDDRYRLFVAELKERVLAARTSAARAVNRDLVLLYWDLGRAIVEQQAAQGWGDSVVELLASDLRREFPGMSGFSTPNVWRMRQLYQVHTSKEFLSRAVRELGGNAPEKRDPEFLSQAVRELVASIPWGHHANVLAKVTDPAARLYYLQATAKLGWSRNVLLNQIKAGAFERAVQERKTHNFDLALPEHLAEQADEMLTGLYRLEVEFALKTKANPIGVAEYQLQAKLPAEFKGKLPTVKQLTEAIRPVINHDPQVPKRP